MVIARSSNLLGKITILVMLGLCVNTAAALLDGSGTQEDPWRIKSLGDFDEFAADANYWDDYTRLETDVNLAGITYSTAVIAPDVNEAEDFFQGIAFTGVFDGNDHKIINLTIDDGGAGNDYLGLFGYIGAYGQVSNLGFEGGVVIGDDFIGGLMGWNAGSILNCYSDVSVKGGSYVGGLAGGNTGGPIYNPGIITGCYSAGLVTGNNSTGGLIGFTAGEGTISNCFSSADVYGDRYIGGLIGLRNIFAQFLGQSSLSNCYVTGNIYGDETVGGLVGSNSGDLPISYCFVAGIVKGTYGVGGLVGMNYSTIINSYWDILTSGESNMCGNPEDPNCDNSYGKTTAEMKQQSTFTDWDFINVWNIGENQTYPYLRVYLAADLNKDGIVNFLDVAITANQWMEGVE